MTSNNIISFLTNREWKISNRNDVFVELSPPQTFNLPKHFKIHIPCSFDKSDSENFKNNIFEIIGEFYSLTSDDLHALLQAESTVLKVRIHDDKTKDGKISLMRFEEVVESIRMILRDTASFVIDRNVTSTRVPEEVSRYLNLCNFLQTEKGSFVAKIQLPSKELIKESELFDRSEVISEQINGKLIEILDFINKDILEGEVEVSEDYLIQNESRINIKLFKDIESFFDKTNLKNIDFTFHNIHYTNILKNENVTKQKLYKLNQFVEQIESHAFEIGEFTFSGKIVGLRSKDPDGLKNSVTYTSLYEHMAIVINANLDSDLYKHAIEAHKLKQTITITGIAKKTKSHARFIEIMSFVIEA